MKSKLLLLTGTNNFSTNRLISKMLRGWARGRGEWGGRVYVREKNGRDEGDGRQRV
jgi:hypothetical protein